jgi:hypothetical protein
MNTNPCTIAALEAERSIINNPDTTPQQMLDAIQRVENLMTIYRGWANAVLVTGVYTLEDYRSWSDSFSIGFLDRAKAVQYVLNQRYWEATRP